ncbi:uncharacterized protein [Prorops nasuta]|uniref:uncharacterized protein n=1 Tax=Prorops nasuta TaxID=863751 RepID=UPI0034CD1767
MGAQLDGKEIAGKSFKEQLQWYLNKKEMSVVTDNRTLIAYVQKKRGTKSLELVNLTYKLLKLLDDLGIELSAVYLPGSYNGIADSLPRRKASPEWHLLPKATEQIVQK